ncbi:MAG: lycopene cyclase domain-containing protein [Microbacter sp.]
MWLYALLLFFSILVPGLLSFDKKLHFYTLWKWLFPSLFIVAAVYIAVDVWFTRLGIWGFNPAYHLPVLWLGLPVEEWLFFFVVPYASIFLHESIVLYFPQWKLNHRISNIISTVLMLFLLSIVFSHLKQAYTVYIFSFVVMALLWSFFDQSHVIDRFYLTFLVILIPFILVNATLTGSFVNRQEVWYNDSYNLGIRFMTIPIEDFGYAFSLILFNLLLMATWRKQAQKRIVHSSSL